MEEPSDLVLNPFSDIFKNYVTDIDAVGCETAYSEQKQVEEEKDFSCDVCGKHFAQKEYLSRHYITHSTENRFTCGTCGRTFARVGTLKNHLQTHQKRYECTMCFQKFVDRTSRKLHRKKVHPHPKRRSHVCDICNVIFVKSTTLLSHYRDHLIEKPYDCTECGQSFAEKEALETHYRFHNRQNLYNCDSCDRTFAHDNELKKHKLVTHLMHKPFSCESCSKSFSLKSQLKKHSTIHLVEKLSGVTFPET